MAKLIDDENERRDRCLKFDEVSSERGREREGEKSIIMHAEQLL